MFNKHEKITISAAVIALVVSYGASSSIQADSTVTDVASSFLDSQKGKKRWKKGDKPRHKHGQRMIRIETMLKEMRGYLLKLMVHHDFATDNASSETDSSAVDESIGATEGDATEASEVSAEAVTEDSDFASESDVAIDAVEASEVPAEAVTEDSEDTADLSDDAADSSEE